MNKEQTLDLFREWLDSGESIANFAYGLSITTQEMRQIIRDGRILNQQLGGK